MRDRGRALLLQRTVADLAAVLECETAELLIRHAAHQPISTNSDAP